MADVAIAKQRQKYTIPLAKMSLGAWPGRTDTKGIVSSLMISLVMIGIMQFGERLDTILTGGLFPVSGRIISITMIGLGTMMYGVVGGLIVAEINPLIATATGTSPIAPFFFLTNSCQMVSAWITGKIFDNVITWKACILNAVLATIFLWVHRKTPEEIVQAIDQAVAKMTADPDYVKDVTSNSMTNTYFNSKRVTAELDTQVARYSQALDYLGLLKK